MLSLLIRRHRDDAVAHNEVTDVIGERKGITAELFSVGG